MALTSANTILTICAVILGVVLQENFLFSGTIRENIAAARTSATYEEVVRAARLAGADEFIERLPRGFETYIYEGSSNLSGGQKQRIALARALLMDPRILILDEATSALDPESEAIVNANLARIAHGRTLIVVSHRLSSLVKSDAILVLERGASPTLDGTKSCYDGARFTAIFGISRIVICRRLPIGLLNLPPGVKALSRKQSHLAIVRQFQSETDAIREAPQPVRARLTLWLLVGLFVSPYRRGLRCADGPSRDQHLWGGDYEDRPPQRLLCIRYLGHQKH